MYENISRRNNQNVEGILFEEVPVESEEDEDVEFNHRENLQRNSLTFQKKKLGMTGKYKF